MSELGRLARALSQRCSRSSTYLYGVLRLAGLRGATAQASGLVHALEAASSEFALIGAAYPACRPWATVLSCGPELRVAMEAVLADQGRPKAEPDGFAPAETQPGQGPCVLGLNTSTQVRPLAGGVAGFVHHLLGEPGDRGAATRRLRAAIYLIGVMRQASFVHLFNGDTTDRWLESILVAARRLDDLAASGTLAVTDEVDDFLARWITLLKESFADWAVAPVDGTEVSPLAALIALRKLLRSTGAATLGLELESFFQRASQLPADPAAPADGNAAGPSLPGAGQGALLADTDADLEEDGDAEEVDFEDPGPDDDATDDSDVSPVQQVGAAAMSRRAEPAGSSANSVGDTKKKRRPWRWGGKPSSVLPERYLLPEHWWALDPDELTSLSAWVELGLTSSCDLLVGCRPPEPGLLESIITAVALSMGQTVEGGAAMRIVRDDVDAELERSGELPAGRYVMLERSIGEEPGEAILAFPPGDRFRSIWATGTAEPIELPKALSRRLGQLCSAVLDAELHELLPFCPDGWADRTSTLLAGKLSRTPAQINLALRHSLARRLYAQTASRALIDLACGGPCERSTTSLRQVALTRYVHPGAARNRDEIRRAVATLLTPSAKLDCHQPPPFGLYLAQDTLAFLGQNLREKALTAGQSRLQAHDAIARYTLALLVLATGHRFSAHMFHFPWDLDITAQLAFICDKLVVGSEARFVPLAQAAVEQLKFYRRHLAALVQELQRSQPALARQIAQAAGLAYRGDRRDPSQGGVHPIGQFFTIDGKTLRSIDASALDEVLAEAGSEEAWLAQDLARSQGVTSVVRLLRRNLATWLWTSGASGLQIEAALGHNRDWHVIGKASSWSVLGDLARVRPMIDDYLRVHGWVPLVDNTLGMGIPLGIVPRLEMGPDGYEGRERAADLALARARAAVQDALTSELGETYEDLLLDETAFEEIRRSATDALRGDARAQDKVLQAFAKLASGNRRGRFIRISAGQLNQIRSEPGPVEVRHSRDLAVANAIREAWPTTLARAIAQAGSAAQAELIRLAGVLGSLVIHDGMLDLQQLWPLLESVNASECLDAMGRFQVRAEVETRSAQFERVLYLSRLTSAAVRGWLVSRSSRSGDALDRNAVESALADMVSTIVTPPIRKGWTVTELVRVQRAWWLLRQPGFVHAIATGQLAGPSADSLSEATLLGAAPARLTRVVSHRARLTQLDRGQQQGQLDDAVKKLFANAGGCYKDGNQASRTQRKKLRELFEKGLPDPLPTLMSDHPTAEVRIGFIEHLLRVGGLEKEYLAFNTIVGYDGRLVGLYQECWGQDIREFDADQFDALYGTLIEQSKSERSEVTSQGKSKRNASVAPVLLMTALKTFHWFMRTRYLAPPSKQVTLALGICRKSRPRTSVLAPRLISPVLTVLRLAAPSQSLANATSTYLLGAHAFGSRSKEVLSAKVRDFNLAAGGLRFRVRSNAANKLKNTRRGRRVIPWPLARPEHAQLLRSAVTTEAHAAGVDRFLMADPGGESVLMDGAAVTSPGSAALKSESGNAAMVPHSLRHGYGTALVCAMTPPVGDVAACVTIRRELSFGLEVEASVRRLQPSIAQWPFNVARASMWHGAGVETLLNVYFHGASWLMAESADEWAQDQGLPDGVWATLLGLTRTTLSKLRGTWVKAEGESADTGWERVVRHYVAKLKLPSADQGSAGEAVGDDGDLIAPSAGHMALTFTTADRLLVRMRREGLSAEALAEQVGLDHALNPSEVLNFLKNKAAVVADTAITDFEPQEEGIVRTTRDSRKGVWRSSPSRQALLSRLDVMAIDEQWRAQMEHLTREWRLWVDAKRPLLVFRSIERLRQGIDLLEHAGLPGEQLSILLTSSVQLATLESAGLAQRSQIVRTRDHRFSRGSKQQALEEFAVEVNDAIDAVLVRNVDLHRAMVTVASLMGNE